LSKEECAQDKDKHLADSSWGLFGFILKDSERIKPISAKGKLNFWEFGGFKRDPKPFK